MPVRKLIWLAVLSSLAYFAVTVTAGIAVSEWTVHPQRRPLTANDEMNVRQLAHGLDSDLADVVLQAHDGPVLSGWSILPRHGNGRAVILLHGLGDNRMGMIGYAEILLRHGFSVLMPDARAHGRSGGEIAGYGLLESADIRQWFDWLEGNQRPSCIFGFGESMGAAQLLESFELEGYFCAVAAESPFSSFREIAYDRVGQFFHTGPWVGRTILRPVVEFAFVYSKWKYGMDFGKLLPASAVAASDIPVFLIHGHDDHNIPVRHSRRIAAVNPAVTLWEVPDTDHCGAINSSPREFELRLLHWFDGHSNAAKAIRMQ
jgi:uncharacterized protein